MFTGLITDVGCVRAVTGVGDRRIKIETSYTISEIELGASIACSGVCLTAVDFGENWFAVEASEETTSKTTVGDWQVGDRLNLERSLRIGDELGGHIVSGHVDGLAEIKSIESCGDSHVVWLQAPSTFARFIAAKGSVALDGVSLTVNAVDGCSFSINVIPHTWTETGWAKVFVGKKMNMEIDMLARYVSRLMQVAGEIK